MLKNAFSNLQKVGKALMLPVSVLPVAGILLGVGAAHFQNEQWLGEGNGHVQMTRPGFMRPWGSSAVLMARIRLSATGFL